MRMSPWRGPFRNGQNTDLQLPEELLRTTPLFTRSVTVVIEAGARLQSLEVAKQFTDRGDGLLCEPGSFLNHDPAQIVTELLMAKVWVGRQAAFNYLVGVSALVEELLEISLPALGG